MAKKFGSSIDLMGAPIFNFGVQAGASYPTTPFEGMVFRRTDLNKYFIYLNAGWRALLDDRIDVTNGAGINKSGTLAAGSLSLSVAYGTAAGTAAQGNDARLSDSRTPTGAAGGDLTGTYPNPTIGANKIDKANIAAELLQSGVTQGAVTGTAATTDAALRSLGTTANSALAGNTRLDQITAPTAPVSLNGQRAINGATPTADSDLATKLYVDTLAQGLNAKAEVVVATTGNISLTGTQTIDGVAVVANDRVLVKDQVTGSQNGIYVASTIGWTRATDADTAAELASAYVFVEKGTVNANTGWLQTIDGFTLGTTDLVWSKFTSAGDLSFNSPLSKTGLTVSLNLNSATMEDNGGLNLKNGSVSALKMGAASVNLASAAGVVTGVLPVANGGTGASTAQAARVALGNVPTRYSNLLSSATAAGVWTAIPGAWNTGLNSTEASIISFYETSTGEEVVFETRNLAGVYQYRSDVAMAANQYGFTLIGAA